jgi:hypothetical protein
MQSEGGDSKEAMQTASYKKEQCAAIVDIESTDDELLMARVPSRQPRAGYTASHTAADSVAAASPNGSNAVLTPGQLPAEEHADTTKARRNLKRREAYAARKSRASASATASVTAGAVGTVAPDTAHLQDQPAASPEGIEATDSREEQAAEAESSPLPKRRRAAKPKPKPVPFAHGPRINSDVEEDAVGIDDLIPKVP